MRYVASEECTVKGPARAVLWVIAYHADRDTGECWVGQRRLARESGLARATVQRALDKLFGDFVLEPVEGHRGPQPERYRIAPTLVEGEVSASGVVEGTVTASGLVEGEVIHTPSDSGLALSPLGHQGNFLVDSLSPASGLAERPAWPLVDSLSGSSGLLPSRSPAETAPKVLDQGSFTSREEQVLDDASSAADAAGVVEAREPPTRQRSSETLARRAVRPENQAQAPTAPRA
jgi:Helix-turn-helix domain